ncbi:hypothetical protein P7C70_g8371, partial [Phenoliferia sp. Uapishka_3]
FSNERESLSSMPFEATAGFPVLTFGVTRLRESGTPFFLSSLVSVSKRWVVAPPAKGENADVITPPSPLTQQSSTSLLSPSVLFLSLNSVTTTKPPRANSRTLNPAQASIFWSTGRSLSRQTHDPPQVLPLPDTRSQLAVLDLLGIDSFQRGSLNNSHFSEFDSISPSLSSPASPTAPIDPTFSVHLAPPNTTTSYSFVTEGPGKSYEPDIYQRQVGRVPPVFDLPTLPHPDPHDARTARIIAMADIRTIEQQWEKMRVQQVSAPPSEIKLRCCNLPHEESVCKKNLAAALTGNIEDFKALFPKGITPLFYDVPLDKTERAREAARFAVSELTVDLNPVCTDGVWSVNIPFAKQIANGEALYQCLEGRIEHITLSHGTIDDVWAEDEERKLLEAQANGGISDADTKRLATLNLLITTTKVAYFKLHEPRFKLPDGRTVPYTELLSIIDKDGNTKGAESSNTGPTVRNVGGKPIFPSALFSNKSAFLERFDAGDRETVLVNELWDAFCDFNGAHLARVAYVTHTSNQMMMMPYELQSAAGLGLHVKLVLAPSLPRFKALTTDERVMSVGSTTQTNHSRIKPAPWSAGFLSRSLGINFGVNHCDHSDCLDQWTAMWNGLRMPPGSFGGVFFHIPSGTYVQIDPTRRSVFVFHGNTNHVGSSPATPPDFSNETDRFGHSWWRWAEVFYPTSRAGSQDGPVILDRAGYETDPVCRASNIGRDGNMPPLAAEGQGASCFGEKDGETLTLNIAIQTLRRNYKNEVLSNLDRLVRIGKIPRSLDSDEQFRLSIANLDGRRDEGTGTHWEHVARQVGLLHELDEATVARITGPWAPWGGGSAEQVERHRLDKSLVEQVYDMTFAAHIPSQSFVGNKDIVVMDRGWVKSSTTGKWKPSDSEEELYLPLLPTRRLAKLEWPSSPDYVEGGIHGELMKALRARSTTLPLDINDIDGPVGFGYKPKRGIDKVLEEEKAYDPKKDRNPRLPRDPKPAVGAPPAALPPATRDEGGMIEGGSVEGAMESGKAAEDAEAVADDVVDPEPPKQEKRRRTKVSPAQ